MITVERAKRVVLENSSGLTQGAESLPLTSSLGRIVSKDIKSPCAIPHFSNSAMDGYALRHRDTKGASLERQKVFNVIESVPAGSVPKKKVGRNEAIRIMTGAPMPLGADAVVIVEQTREAKSERRKAKSEEFMRTFKELKRWENVRRAGEDIRKGEVVLRKGTLIRSQELMMLAALGMSSLKVTRRPRVAILATGDELIEVKSKLAPGKIRNSNSYGLYGSVLSAGGEPIILGIARDNSASLLRAFKDALRRKIDILLVVGGISVGDYDIVKDLLKQIGTKMLFWKVAMRPGKPLAFGMIGKVLVFGLPGNPVSSTMAFEQFVRPALQKMLGYIGPAHFVREAYFEENFEKRKGFRYFVRVKLRNEDGKFFARLSGPQGSAMLKSMAHCDGVMVLPEGIAKVSRGDKVNVQLLN